MYRRYQEAQSNPDFAKALDHVSVKPSGDRLKIDAPVSQDELLSLIRTKALAPSSDVRGIRRDDPRLAVRLSRAARRNT